MAVRNQNNKDFSLYMNMNALNWDWLSTSTQPGRAAIIYAEDQKFYTTVATVYVQLHTQMAFFTYRSQTGLF